MPEIGSPNSNVRSPYRAHSKRIILSKSWSDMPTERSMASSRLRNLIFVEIVLNTFAIAINVIIMTKIAVNRLTINTILRFSSSIAYKLFRLYSPVMPAPSIIVCICAVDCARVFRQEYCSQLCGGGIYFKLRFH